ncbi:twin-arginine translocase TatA/TatE family subunit [Microbacterium sp. RURRCA19A]|uniref:twin-arginine translocase TatA/TatE family subunit n=1 Tax=Microbacterium sp. RURRCA19A TaxID=1907391 RepID=UPI0009574263|nr:twin-arginine translocase TatA/TatE family subunit [Microbacterium sp. RURRCA19A]SIS11035.1 sec-independent protein translocase protein TatA [Microbacterium sp. RURRCA19A]
MLQNLTGWHALLILAVVVLIFGAAKLPALARSVGQSMRILKQESEADRTPEPETTAVPTVTDAAPRTAPVEAAPQRHVA